MGAAKLEEIIEVFQSVDQATRLELLLDYSNQLPAVSERHAAERDAGLHQVPECMSPVFLWIEPDPEDENRRRLIVDVAEEAPTIKGFLSIIVQAYDRSTTDEMREIPVDLLHRLGLADVIRMNRAQGLGAIINRIRNAAADAAPATD